PAMIRGSVMQWAPGCGPSSAPPRAHDLDAVAGLQRSCAPGRARHNRAIERNRNAALADVERLLGKERSEGGDRERLVLAIAADGGRLGHKSLRGARRRKPLDAERPNGRVERAVNDELRDGIGGDRREQDTIAMVPGRIDEPRRRPGSENWR